MGITHRRGSRQAAACGPAASTNASLVEPTSSAAAAAQVFAACGLGVGRQGLAGRPARGLACQAAGPAAGAQVRARLALLGARSGREGLRQEGGEAGRRNGWAGKTVWTNPAATWAVQCSCCRTWAADRLYVMCTPCGATQHAAAACMQPMPCHAAAHRHALHTHIDGALHAGGRQRLAHVAVEGAGRAEGACGHLGVGAVPARGAGLQTEGNDKGRQRLSKVSIQHSRRLSVMSRPDTML